MNLELQVIGIEANDTYFSALERLNPVIETIYFIEKVYPHKGIFVRHDKRISSGDRCLCFIEPQINLTDTVRRNTELFTTKIQFTVIKYYGKATARDRDNGVYVSPFIHRLAKDDFFDGLPICNEWKSSISEFLKDFSI